MPGSQLSVPSRVAGIGMLEQDTVMFCGSGFWLNTGAVSSTTLMVWVKLVAFPQASVAVQVRVMVFSWGQMPGVVFVENTGVTAPQLSVAVTTGIDGSGSLQFTVTGVAGRPTNEGAVPSMRVL